MHPFFFVIVFLRLSLATAVNFTQVYQWDELDYEYPSEANRTQTLRDGPFNQENISPRYMAVYETRLFISLYKYNNIPVSLVSLPTSSASSEPPKLTPFPSMDMHGKGNCNQIKDARGMQVDAVGRLWVLDSGSENCSAKLMTIDLVNKDNTKLTHQFPFHSSLHDLVLDEMANGTFAYITQSIEQRFVVFSLEKNQSWLVDTPGIDVYSIALSPKKDQEPRQLYFGKWNSNELYSTSVAALRNGTRTANPKLIGKWTGKPYRMLMDNHGILYAAFSGEHYILSWNSSQPFQEQRFHEVGKLSTEWPFAFALDSSETFWLTVLNGKGTKPRCRLLRAAVGAKPYTCDSSTTGKCQKDGSTKSALIGSLVLFLVLSLIINLWLTLRIRKLQNSSEQRNAGTAEMETPSLPHPVSPEMVDEEIENDLYGVIFAPPPQPWL